MTHRDRILTVFRHEVPDRVPLHFINIDDIRPYLERLGLKDREELALRFDIGIRRIWPRYRREMSDADRDRLATGLYDDFKPISPFGTSGGGETYSAQGDYPHPFAEADSIRDIERFPWPDPDDWDCGGIESAIDALGGRYAIMLGSWSPVFDQVLDFFSMDQALVNIRLRPDLIEATVERVTGFWYALYERYFAAAAGKADIFSMGDDFAGQLGMLLDPRDWRRFLMPAYRRLFGLAKAHGLRVWFHSCGAITPVLPDLIEAGLDVWETVQAHLPGNEPERIKREFGRDITFFGGINTQATLPFGTPDAVRREVRERIRVLGKGGGYICGPDHHIKPHFPLDNVLAMVEEIEGFRGEGYTRSTDP
jgi:uroporphyrinogen decarboxylase